MTVHLINSEQSGISEQLCDDQKFLITKFYCSMYIRVSLGGHQEVSTCNLLVSIVRICKAEVPSVLYKYICSIINIFLTLCMMVKSKINFS